VRERSINPPVENLGDLHDASDVLKPEVASPRKLAGSHEPESMARPAHLRNVGVSRVTFEFALVSEHRDRDKVEVGTGGYRIVPKLVSA
jgi:hypothetical protein